MIRRKPSRIAATYRTLARSFSDMSIAAILPPPIQHYPVHILFATQKTPGDWRLRKCTANRHYPFETMSRSGPRLPPVANRHYLAKMVLGDSTE